MDEQILPAMPPGIALSNETLAAVGDQIAVPEYDRRELATGIVHFGVGGFHRAHQATYLDEVAQRGSRDWGVLGVSVRHRRMRDALAPQDWLYTVAARDERGAHARAIGVLGGILFAPAERERVLAALEAPATRLATLTITGGAYEEAPAGPNDVFSLLAAGLDRRRRRGAGPLTILSCDNVPDNGAVARAALLRAAAAQSPVLATWIERHVSLPSSVVDRITPKTCATTRAFVGRRFGVTDRSPVITEPFSQWIIEDDFCAERPPLEEVGVHFVGDVATYERMKKRLLNGGHCALGYLGRLAGHERTDEALADPVLRGYLRALMDEEITPHLDDVPGIDLDAYKDDLIERFSNPAVGDELARLCERGSIKVPAYLLPSIEDALATGSPSELLALALAGYLRFLRGTDRRGRPLQVVDPLRARLVALARAGGSDPRPLLGQRDVFGDLIDCEPFVAAVAGSLGAIDRRGVTAAMAEAAPSLAFA